MPEKNSRQQLMMPGMLNTSEVPVPGLSIDEHTADSKEFSKRECNTNDIFGTLKFRARTEKIFLQIQDGNL